MTNAPIVSILMPMYNAERYLATALTSLLHEQDLPLEVIVIDDGSTDRSLEQLHPFADPRLKLIPNSGKGVATALNTGLAAAQADIVIRCDADDRYPADRLRKQVEWLTQHPEFGAVCGNYGAIDAKGNLVIQFSCGAIAEEITQELRHGITRTHLCTFAIRTELLRDLGGFRPYFLNAEDIDLQLRLGEISRVWYTPDLCYYYRLHNTSVTHSKSSIEREFFDRIAQEFQQQRLSSGKDDLQRGCPPERPPTNQIRLTAAAHIQGFLLSRAWQEFEQGHLGQALITGLRAALAQPDRLSVWRSLLILGIRTLLRTGQKSRT